MTNIAHLPDRGVVAVHGPDRVAFLQGLVSNDVEQAAPGRAIWAAFLTPQGKWLADFFILVDGERLLLDVERAQAPMLVQKLTRFRLRSKVTLADLSAEFHVHAAWHGSRSFPEDAITATDTGAGWTLQPPAPQADLPLYFAWGEPPVAPPAAIVVPDPRLTEAGWRILSPELLPASASAADWDSHRLALGLPDGSRDLEADKTVLLEAGFDELDGVSWSKGCYMGQELTARTKYRGLIKRRLLPVDIAGPLPPPGTPVLRDGTEVGTLRSGRDGAALATLRLDSLGAALTCDGISLSPRLPFWLHLPDAAKP